MRKGNENSFLIPRKGGMNVDVQVFFPPTGRPEESALEHLKSASRLPSSTRVIGLPNLSPENTFASGCVVGTGNTVVPGIVGEDINGGIRLISTPVAASDVRPRQIEDAIRKAVPFGEKSANLMLHEGDFRLVLEFGIAGLSDISNRSGNFWKARIDTEEESDARKTAEKGSILSNSTSVSHNAIERGKNQLGTAGGMGHFIDILAVEGIFDERTGKDLGLFKDQLVFSFNVGSRGFGRQVTEEYMRLARELNGEQAPEQELSFLNVNISEAEPYLQALGCAMNFASVNRQIITTLIRQAVRSVIGKKAMPLICDVSHNTLKREEHGTRTMWVHRRGACGIKPGNGGSLHVSENVALISGSPTGASYVLALGEKCASTLNSLCVNAGYAMGRETNHTKGQAAPQRNVDAVVRYLVDSGLAKIISRLRPLASIRA